MAKVLTLKGDFKALQKWQAQLNNTTELLQVVSENLAEEAIDLVKEGFATETDPYGKKWAALQLRSGKILQKDGGLKGSWNPKRVTKKGFMLASGKAYAVYHQDGTGLFGPKNRRITPKKAKALKLGKSGLIRRSVKGSPRRLMVPVKDALPPAWSKRFVDVAGEVLEAHFSK